MDREEARVGDSGNSKYNQDEKFSCTLWFLEKCRSCLALYLPFDQVYHMNRTANKLKSASFQPHIATGSTIAMSSA